MTARYLFKTTPLDLQQAQPSWKARRQAHQRDIDRWLAGGRPGPQPVMMPRPLDRVILSRPAMEKVLSGLKPEDELWVWEDPPRMGLAVLRHGIMVESITTSLRECPQ